MNIRNNQTEHFFRMSHYEDNVAAGMAKRFHNVDLYTLLYKRIYTAEKKKT